jgi:hypothetical protein
MGEMGHEYKVLIREPETKNNLRKLAKKLEGNIKDFNKIRVILMAQYQV